MANFDILKAAEEYRKQADKLRWEGTFGDYLEIVRQNPRVADLAHARVYDMIMASDVGITPTTAGVVIRLNMPPLTEERRRELAKHVAHEGENAKVAIRNVRRDALQQVKDLLKEKLITEDDERRAEDEIQKLTDRFVKDVDSVVKHKEEELMAL